MPGTGSAADNLPDESSEYYCALPRQASVNRNSAFFIIHLLTVEKLHLAMHSSCCICIPMLEMKHFKLLVAFSLERNSGKESWFVANSLLLRYRKQQVIEA